MTDSSSRTSLDRFRRFRRPRLEPLLLSPRLSFGRPPRPFTALWQGIPPIFPITSLLRIPPVAPYRNENGSDVIPLSEYSQVARSPKYETNPRPTRRCAKIRNEPKARSASGDRSTKLV